MIKIRPHLLAVIFVLLFGIVLFYTGTDGFTAYTTETARVNQLAKNQPQFPKVTFEDSKERSYSISEFAGKYVFITFFYSSCPTVCVKLEKNMAQVYDKLPTPYMGKEIVFLSISFDPKRDNPTRLEKYRTYFKSDGETWRMARINDQTELDRLLKKFGVTVIPDENGGFAHNSAFYLVDKKGTLVEVMDYTKMDEAAGKVISIIENDAGRSNQ